MGKRKTRYIIEYDYVLMTVNHEEKPPEHRIEIHILFEDALSSYRKIINMENFLGYPSSQNIKTYAVFLDEEFNFNQFLN